MKIQSNISKFTLPAIVLSVFVTQSAFAVRNGDPTNQEEFRNVGFVQTGLQGTGVLIWDKVLLTANHVLDNAGSPQRLRFVYHSKGAPIIGAEEKIELPIPGADLILIKLKGEQSLEDYFTKKPVPEFHSPDSFNAILPSSLSVGETGEVVGFGSRMIGEETVLSPGFSKGKLVLSERFAQGGIHYLAFRAAEKNQNMTPRDSGRPIYITRGNQKFLAGIAIESAIDSPTEADRNLDNDQFFKRADVAIYLDLTKYREEIVRSISGLSGDSSKIIEQSLLSQTRDLSFNATAKCMHLFGSNF